MVASGTSADMLMHDLVQGLVAIGLSTAMVIGLLKFIEAMGWSGLLLVLLFIAFL